MALPEKDYFTLDDLAKRWGADLGSLRYYAEHAFLEVQVWLGKQAVKVYQAQETRSGEKALVQVGLRIHNGYVILAPDEVRQVFRYGKRAIDKFTALDRGSTYKILGKAKYKIETADLVVGKSERDRFEMLYEIHLKTPKIEEAIESRTGHVPSFSGRSSVMFRIMEEMRQRAASGKMEPSLKREAEQLHSWAALAIKDHQVPKAASIANALRHAYLRMKEQPIPHNMN